MTILDILESRGCDAHAYRNFSPSEASEAAEKVDSLNFTIEHPSGKIIHVQYHDKILNRSKIESIVDEISDEDSENTEFILISVTAPVTEAQHQIAIKQYLKWKETEEDEEKERRKLRISIFNMDMIVCNPLKHVLVPKHEIIPENEHAELMKSMYITSKSKFPEIKYHIDPIARCIGAVPGDIIRITRPSASCGEAIIYRVCAV